jgi:hypothetical protein
MGLISALAVLLASLQATAQNAPRSVPAPAQPYKTVAIAPPKPMTDPAFDAVRKQLGEAVKRKDRAALAKLVVAQGFFWQREGRESADKRKTGIDNLATALGLDGKGGVGWDILSTYAEEPFAAPSSLRKGATCAPPDPVFSGAEFADLLRTTQTDESEWGYPTSSGIEVHATPQANAPTIERLGLVFVRVIPENTPASLAYLRIVTPAGKTGYVSVDSLAPIGSEQLCYVKDASDWKIGGYIGGGDPQ